jgi:acetylornithine deacetylase/succinyl-diaminopimelate desuccinylase-like protein
MALTFQDMKRAQIAASGESANGYANAPEYNRTMRFARLVICLVGLSGRCLADDALVRRDDVKKALVYIETSHEKTLASQVTIAEISAATFHEGERARYMAGEFRRLGLRGVEIDKQGNVLGWRDGQSPDAFVLAAHLDIAFAPGVNTKVRKEGARWYGPGLADDSRGLASLLTIVEAMNHAEIKTRQTILFVANVGEEGNGDLNGVRYLFKESPYRSRLREFISIDGTSAARIVNGGTGVKRYLITLRGPGGHSYGNFGRPSPIHAAGRIIDRFADTPVPKVPKTTFNVGRISGGTSVNAIAEECSFEVDLRSEDPGTLDRIEVKLLEAVRLGVEEENKARAASKASIKAETKLIGNRPAGRVDVSNPLVQSAEWAVAAMGERPELVFSSTDANLPISLGIPALTMGGGGSGGNAHSLNEYYEPADAWKGPQVVLLTVLEFDSRR